MLTLYKSKVIGEDSASVLLGMPTSFHPATEIVVYTGFYKVLEFALDIELSEITLEDISNGLPVIVDLREEEKLLLKKERVKEGDIVQARIKSSVSKLGQTEAWKILNFKRM